MLMEYMQQTFVVIPSWGEYSHQLLDKVYHPKAHFKLLKQFMLPILFEKCFRRHQKISALRVPLSPTSRPPYGQRSNGIHSDARFLDEHMTDSKSGPHASNYCQTKSLLYSEVDKSNVET